MGPRADPPPELGRGGQPGSLRGTAPALRGVAAAAQHAQRRTRERVTSAVSLRALGVLEAAGCDQHLIQLLGPRIA